MTDALQPYLDAHAEAVDEIARLAAEGDQAYLDGLRHHIRVRLAATLPPPCTSPAGLSAESPSVQVGDTGIEPVTSSVSGKRTVQVRASAPRDTVEWWCAMLRHVSWWRTATLPESCTNHHPTGHTARHRPPRTVDHQEHAMTTTRITPAPGANHTDKVEVEPRNASPGDIYLRVTHGGFAHDTGQRSRTGVFVDAANVPALALGALLAAGVPEPTVEHHDDGFEIATFDGLRTAVRGRWRDDKNDALERAAAYLLAAVTLVAGPPVPEPDPEAEARAAIPDEAVDALRLALVKRGWADDTNDLHLPDMCDLLAPVFAALKATEPEPEPAWTPAVGEWVVVTGDSAGARHAVETNRATRVLHKINDMYKCSDGFMPWVFAADLRPATPEDAGARYEVGDTINAGDPDAVVGTEISTVIGSTWERASDGWKQRVPGGSRACLWSLFQDYPEDAFPATVTAVPDDEEAS